MNLSDGHPGQVLKNHFMRRHGVTQDALAKAIGVDRQRINAIICGRREMTANTAFRLAAFFGTTVEYWLSLHMHQVMIKAQADKALMAACTQIKPVVSAAVQPKVTLKKRLLV